MTSALRMLRISRISRISRIGRAFCTRSIVPSSTLTVLPLLLMLGCGGRLGVEAPTTVDSGGTVTDSGGDSSSGDTFGDSTPFTDSLTPDFGADLGKESGPPTPKTCDTLVEAICGSAEACCTKHGHTYSKTGCSAAIAGYCASQVDAVKAGKATYDESYLDACAKSWVDELKLCDLDFITYSKDNVACSQLFNGLKAPGDACNPSGYECKAPSGAAAYCDQSAKKCRVYMVVGKDQPCNFYGSTIRYCDNGLYCDLTATSPTCATQKKLGDACDGVDDFSCGYNNVCKANVCTVGLAGGAACTDNNECASYQCKTSKCVDANFTIASSYVCNGTAGG